MYKAKLKDKTFEVSIEKSEVKIDGNPFDWDVSKLSDRSYHIVSEGRSFNVEVVKIDREVNEVSLKINGKPISIALQDKLSLLLEKLGMDMSATAKVNDVKAPMPGLILEIQVKEGDEVKKGDPIMILEAMKMENILKSPGEGIVTAVKVKKGDSVEKNEVLVLF